MRCSPSTLSLLAQHGDLDAARALRSAGWARDLRPLAGTAAMHELRAASRRDGVRLEPCIFAELAKTEPPVRPTRSRAVARAWWPDGVPHPDGMLRGVS